MQHELLGHLFPPFTRLTTFLTVYANIANIIVLIVLPFLCRQLLDWFSHTPADGVVDRLGNSFRVLSPQHKNWLFIANFSMSKLKYELWVCWTLPPLHYHHSSKFLPLLLQPPEQQPLGQGRKAQLWVWVCAKLLQNWENLLPPNKTDLAEN